MPHPEEKPPTKRVDELVTEITKEYWDKYSHFSSSNFKELHERDTKMINELIKELAILKAENEILKK